MASKLFETNFFTADVQKSTIKNSDLTDCLFVGTKDRFTIRWGTPHRITRPVIALAWNFRENGAFAVIINEALKDCGAIPLKFDYSLGKINAQLLDREVRSLIQDIRQDRREIFSLPDEIIKRGQAYSEIAKISARAKDILRHSHGLILPGGEDIEREFYDPSDSGGYQEIPSLFEEDDYRRSIFEFALAREARQTNTPTMGICRGSQLFNVYCGGTLKQHVDNHLGAQHELVVIETAPIFAKEVMRKIMTTDKLFGLSLHHQASDKIGKELTVVLKVEEVPEAMISENGLFILTQFHPEIYWSIKQILKGDLEFKAKDKKKHIKLDFSYLDRPEFADNQNFFNYLLEQARKKEILVA